MPTAQDKTAKEAASSAQAAMQQLQAAVGTLRAKYAELGQRKTELEQRRELLYQQPLAADDIRQFVGEVIDSRAQAYASKAKNYGLLQNLAYPKSRYPGEPRKPEHKGYGNAPLTLEDAEYVLGNPLSIAGRGDRIDSALPVFLRSAEFEFGWPYFFFGDVFKEKISQLLEGEQITYRNFDAHEVGPPITERRVEIQSINEKLHSIGLEMGRVHSEVSSLTNPIMQSAQLVQSTDGETQ